MRVQAPAGAASGPSRQNHRVVDVRVLGASMSDTEAVLAMAARCSRTTLFHRFHGFTNGVSYLEALLRGEPENETHLAWYRSRCIGLATIAPNARGTADLGVVVEDHWQRRGIGTRLVASLLADAPAIGVTTLHADVLRDDIFILQALRRIGPLSVSMERDAVSADITLGTALRSPAR